MASHPVSLRRMGRAQRNPSLCARGSNGGFRCALPTHPFESADLSAVARWVKAIQPHLIQLFKEPQVCVRIPGPRWRPSCSAEHHPLKSKRAQGMPGEGLTHGPPAIGKAGGRYHRCSQIIRHSLRDGFNAYSVLSPGTGLSCPRRRAIISRGLTSASGGQDHTSSRPPRRRSSARQVVRAAKASIASPPHVR
jgi:hypothetical protein